METSDSQKNKSREQKSNMRAAHAQTMCFGHASGVMILLCAVHPVDSAQTLSKCKQVECLGPPLASLPDAPWLSR